MAKAWIEDLWYTDQLGPDGRRIPSQRHGRGRQWRVRWYDHHRVPKSKSFRTKRDAEAWQATIDHELRDGTYRDRTLGQTSFATVAEEWLAARTDIEPSTRRLYRSALDVHLLPAWGHIPVDRLRRNQLAAWLAQLGLRRSPATVIGVHRVMSMTLSWAVDTDRLARNPAARLPLPRTHEHEHVYLTHHEVNALAEAAGSYHALILTLAYTGLRFGEVSALTVANVDLDSHRLAITQAWAGANTEAPYLTTPKNHERRRVAIPAFLATELIAALDGRSGEQWLFTSPHGHVLNLPNWRRRDFNPAVRTAGLERPGLTPHALRHTAASLAIAAGADVKVVQNMLGHKDATITLNTYAGLFPDRLDEVAHALDRTRRAALATSGPTP